MAVESARGVRDFEPKDMIIRNNLISNLRVIFEKYGFMPLQTPLIERLDVLTAKFAAGEDSDASREIFKFLDQGKRNLGLRFDLTVPLSRFVAQNPNMKLPFKRYEIGRVFRDGPIKLGRYREFIQCDVDTIGVAGIEAEAELILLALDAFKTLNLDAFIEINDRNIITDILNHFKLDESKQEEAIIILDKLKKIGKNEVVKELISIGVDNASDMMDTFTDVEKIKKVANTENIDKLLDLLPIENVKFTPTLARGLAYYTGTVFEGFLKDSKVKSSICGGGRYDNMIRMYGNKNFPAVGISFGIEPITESMKSNQSQEIRTQTKVFVLPIGTFPESLNIAQQLRESNINTEIDLMGKGISKNLNYVNAKSIPYTLFVGEDEINNNKFKLKDMVSGVEEELTLDEIKTKLK